MFEFLDKIRIIQGGMGPYVSNPFLAKKVCQHGGLGTVSGVAAERILPAILQRGDPNGHYRRALATFPFQDSVERIMDAFFIEDGKWKNHQTRAVPVSNLDPSTLWIDLAICANYAFVWLAKEGHDQPVSINWLEKIVLPHVYAITGAMLAGVNIITMGAGLPLHIPAVINNLVNGQPLSYPIPIVGEKNKHIIHFDPKKFFGADLPTLTAPAFIPIISSNVLAEVCMERIPDAVQGFVVEKDTAGGHNASPRGRLILNERGEPVYGPRDRVNYQGLARLGKPFWVGGSYAHPGKVEEALGFGACGVQIGSAFALCDDSGITEQLRARARHLAFERQLQIRTSPDASPTGYPFKIALIPGTLSDKQVFERRPRICNHGALVELFRRDDGTIGCQCSASPGNLSGKALCLCNGLIASAGLNNEGEPCLLTLGDDTSFVEHLMEGPDDSYGVPDVFNYLNRR